MTKQLPDEFFKEELNLHLGKKQLEVLLKVHNFLFKGKDDTNRVWLAQQAIRGRVPWKSSIKLESIQTYHNISLAYYNYNQYRLKEKEKEKEKY